MTHFEILRYAVNVRSETDAPPGSSGRGCVVDTCIFWFHTKANFYVIIIFFDTEESI